MSVMSEYVNSGPDRINLLFIHIQMKYLSNATIAMQQQATRWDYNKHMFKAT
jgi:hypothetical protein